MASDQHIVYKKDGEGSTIKVGEIVYNNVIVQHPPMFSHLNQVLKQLQDFPSREGDIWLIDYMKSGTNWMISIVDLLNNQAIKHCMSKVKYGMLEPAADLRDFEAMTSPRVINTHMMLELIPQKLLDQNKVIMMVRNPKSVAVSLYNHMKTLPFCDYNGSFNGFLPGYIDGYYTGFYGNWFEFVLEYWQAYKDKPNVMFVFYEELKKEPVKIIQEISSFLGLSHDLSYIESVADQTSFDQLKQKQKEISQPHTLDQSKQKHHSKVLDAMYRKGTITDWKNHFTVAQNEMFDAAYEAKMKDYPDLKDRIQFS